MSHAYPGGAVFPSHYADTIIRFARSEAPSEPGVLQYKLIKDRTSPAEVRPRTTWDRLVADDDPFLW